MTNFQEKSNFIWDIANLLRDNFDKTDFQKIILPFTVLRRFDYVLDYSKDTIVKTYENNKDMDKNALHNLLININVDEKGNQIKFYNYSNLDFEKLLDDPAHIKENTLYYVDSFSDNVKNIFDYFELRDWIDNDNNKNLLYLLIKKFSDTDIDLSPKAVSNHEMGTIFEDLIRRFSESTNEESGEHFTPRDIVKLMTELMFVDEDLGGKGIVKTIYDPACGTGGMLTSCEEFILEKNVEKENIYLYGQEIKDRIYALCKSDMLMKGKDFENIKGPSSTLSDDQLKGETFDYIISNPPYGKKWEQDKEAVLAEAKLGDKGRFGAGTPAITDGQLLFIQHMISKMHKDNKKSRIAVITNGSPLFKGDAGQGETEIRRRIFERDYLETLIALPDSLFFNTNIGTYIWILTNKKSEERKGKVQLIDARDYFAKMRKSLGNKRNYIPNEHISNIINLYHSFEESDKVKIFDNDDFGYTKIIVERPQQFNYQVTEERLNNLYGVSQFKNLAISKSKDFEIKEKEESEGKQKQEEIINALKEIPAKKYSNWNEFGGEVKNVLEPFNLKPAFIKNVILALSEHDDSADYVTNKKEELIADPKLKDYEKVPLKEDIGEYFEEEVLKYYPNAWFDEKNNIKGYEVNFTQYFYVYEPPRLLEEIEADLDRVTEEILELRKR